MRAPSLYSYFGSKDAIADVVDVLSEEDWGRPTDCVLTGPVGGTFTSGAVGPDDVLELDAVEFCRIVSGRAPGDGLLATEVPF